MTLEERQSEMKARQGPKPLSRTRAERKAAHLRRLGREATRRYRAKKREAAERNAEFVLPDAPPPVLWPQAPPRPEVPKPAYIPPIPAALPAPMPEIPPRPSFRPSTRDPFRPAWWADVDPNPKTIELSLDPRVVRRAPPISTDGLQTVRVWHDEGVSFSDAEGHRDIAAEREQRKAEQERRSFDHRALRPGETL